MHPNEAEPEGGIGTNRLERIDPLDEQADQREVHERAHEPVVGVQGEVAGQREGRRTRDRREVPHAEHTAEHVREDGAEQERAR